MTDNKFEDRLNRINAKVQPVGSRLGGGSGSWRNGEQATGREPRIDALHTLAPPPQKAPGLRARLIAALKGLRGR